MSEWLRVADAVAKPSCPDPSVLRNWLVLPSDVGNFNPLTDTVPEPLADNSRSAFVVLVEIVLSVMVTPSMTALVFAVTHATKSH